MKNAAPILYELLAKLFRMYLIHGHISSIIMVSTAIPLIKDKLGDISLSNNYRSIAFSSLILDWIILLLHGAKLSTDELQFGYQQKTSTNMCTWLAIETIDYFLRNGSEGFVGVMDMMKAFDNVKQSVFFWKLIDKGIPPIYLRFLLNIALCFVYNVCWNGTLSDTFPIGIGVKHGGVLSPHFYCIYTDDLFTHLRKKKTGCWVEGKFVGILGYAADLLLLSPSLDGLHEMIKSCKEHVRILNLSFSTNANLIKCKMKCMAFLNQEREMRNITLDGKDLPWVRTEKHFGCKIDDKIYGLNDDLMEKRATYINKVNELTHEFYFDHPLTKVRINNIFNSHFYGSAHWELFGIEALRLEKSWDVSQRIMLGIPRNSHRYFIEPMSDTKHKTFSLFKKYIKFVDSIESSSKSVLKRMLRIVRRDCRTNTGQNLRKFMRIAGKTRIDDLKKGDFNDLIYTEIPAREERKIRLAEELIEMKNRIMDVKIRSN